VFDAVALVAVAEASRWLFPSDGLWRGTIYALEPSIVIAGVEGLDVPSEANPFFATAPPPTGFLLWSALWVALVLGGAVVSLSRRDL
jgi:hypothetical protein